MGRNQHNAGLHFVKYRHKEDLSIYDEMVQENRERDRIRHLQIGNKVKEREEEIRHQELKGLFSEEKNHDVRFNRFRYFSSVGVQSQPLKPNCYNHSVYDKCGGSPGTKQLIDASAYMRPGFFISVNMFKIAYYKKIDLRLIVDAVSAIMYDDAMVNSEEYRMPVYFAGPDMICLSLLAEGLECEMHELLVDTSNKDLQDLVISILEELDNPFYWKIECDDGSKSIRLRCFGFEKYLGMEKLEKDQTEFPPEELMIEKVKLENGHFSYLISYTLGGWTGRRYKDYEIVRSCDFYGEERGCLQEFTDRMIAKNKRIFGE